MSKNISDMNFDVYENSNFFDSIIESANSLSEKEKSLMLDAFNKMDDDNVSKYSTEYPIDLFYFNVAGHSSCQYTDSTLPVYEDLDNENDAIDNLVELVQTINDTSDNIDTDLIG